MNLIKHPLAALFAAALALTSTAARVLTAARRRLAVLAGPASDGAEAAERRGDEQRHEPGRRRAQAVLIGAAKRALGFDAT